VRLLLDTHVYLWSLASPDRLSARLQAELRDRQVPVYVSAVSVWECAIKRRLGRLSFPDHIDLVAAIDASGFTELPVTAAHAARTETLPDLHRDPFDRLLIAQALEEAVTLVSADRQVRTYPDLELLEP